MTLVAAWVRNRKPNLTAELIVASDSRVTGGLMWDFAPKVFPVSRGDTVLAFAGETHYAYPLVMQIRSSIDQYAQSANRATDISELVNHIIGILNLMILNISDTPYDKQEFLGNICKILIAGYSWKNKCFVIYRMDYNKVSNQFVAHRVGGKNKTFCFVGDREKEAHASLQRSLQDKSGIDYEPLDVLLSQIDDISPEYRSIGGPVQFVKVFEHLNSLPYATLWKDKDSSMRITYMGRPLMPYEKTRYLLFNPYNRRRIKMWDYRSTEEIIAEATKSVEADQIGSNGEFTGLIDSDV